MIPLLAPERELHFPSKNIWILFLTYFAHLKFCDKVCYYQCIYYLEIMKNAYYMKQLLAILFLGLMLSSCKGPVKELIIDNPTKIIYTISFSGLEPLTLGAKESKKINIPYGKQTISINGVDHKINLDADNSYILNPSMSRYYIENVVYTMNGKGADQYNRDYGKPRSDILNPDSDSVSLNVMGDYQLIEPKLLLVQNWKFGLGEEPAMSGNVGFNPQLGYTLVKKLHRHEELYLGLVRRSLDAALEDLLLDEQ